MSSEEENPFFIQGFLLFVVGSNTQPDDSLGRKNLNLHSTQRKEREEDGHFLYVGLWDVDVGCGIWVVGR
jgi:hypothetical protein